MKKVALLAVIVFIAVTGGVGAFAQAAPLPDAPQPQNVYAAGVSYNNAASPSIAGTALYAHSLADKTYAFTVVDFLPQNTKPFTVTSNISAGIAQKVFTIHNVPIYSPTAAGISFTGQNTGWAWSTGGLASFHVKGKYLVMPGVRVLKSSIGGGGYQPVVSVLFGFGE